VLGRRCLPAELTEDQTLEFENEVTRSKSLDLGEHLFRTGDSFHSLYAIHSGCFKSYTIDQEGREHVLNFHFPGELIGVDAVYQDVHSANAAALENSSVCQLPYKSIMALSFEMPELHFQLLRLFSREVFYVTTIAGDFTAEERMAAFLMMVSGRLRTHGQSASMLHLAMSRQDIANYMRMATETVSRVLARFESNGLLEADRKNIVILDTKGLAEVAVCMNPYTR